MYLFLQMNSSYIYNVIISLKYTYCLVKYTVQFYSEILYIIRLYYMLNEKIG